MLQFVYLHYYVFDIFFSQTNAEYLHLLVSYAVTERVS